MSTELCESERVEAVRRVSLLPFLPSGCENTTQPLAPGPCPGNGLINPFPFLSHLSDLLFDSCLELFEGRACFH